MSDLTNAFADIFVVMSVRDSHSRFVDLESKIGAIIDASTIVIFYPRSVGLCAVTDLRRSRFEQPQHDDLCVLSADMFADRWSIYIEGDGLEYVDSEPPNL